MATLIDIVLYRGFNTLLSGRVDVDEEAVTAALMAASLGFSNGNVTSVTFLFVSLLNVRIVAVALCSSFGRNWTAVFGALGSRAFLLSLGPSRSRF